MNASEIVVAGRVCHVVRVLSTERKRPFFRIADREPAPTDPDAYYLNHASTWDHRDNIDEGNEWPTEQAAREFAEKCAAAHSASGEVERTNSVDEIAERLAVYAWSIDGLLSLPTEEQDKIRDVASWIIRDRLDPPAPQAEPTPMADNADGLDRQAEAERLTRRVSELESQHEQDQLAVAYAPENAWHDLTKAGIEFYEIDGDGEPYGDKRKIVYVEDKGDSSVGISASAWWQAVMPKAGEHDHFVMCGRFAIEALELGDDANSPAEVRDAITTLRRELESATKRADAAEATLDALEKAATEIEPYPPGYRPSAWEAAVQLPESLRACKRELDEARARLLTAAGDDLCRLSQEEIKGTYPFGSSRLTTIFENPTKF